MPDLVEEKYLIADLLSTFEHWTAKDLKRKLRRSELPSALYAVVEDLLTRKCIKVAPGEVLSLDSSTFTFDTETAIVYTILPEQREFFKQYVEELDKQRFQPDEEGKPRGSSYRVVEALLEDVTARPEILQQKETVIAEYFALAQEEEIVQCQYDSRQRNISEAYIRTLYGKFMSLKAQWEEAILQFLAASLLFDVNKPDSATILETLRLAAEHEACEILKSKYVLDQQRNFIEACERLTQLRLKARNIEIKHKAKSSSNQLLIFSSLLETMLQESARQVHGKIAPYSFREFPAFQLVQRLNSYLENAEKNLNRANSIYEENVKEHVYQACKPFVSKEMQNRMLNLKREKISSITNENQTGKSFPDKILQSWFSRLQSQ